MVAITLLSEGGRWLVCEVPCCQKTLNPNVKKLNELTWEVCYRRNLSLPTGPLQKTFKQSAPTRHLTDLQLFRSPSSLGLNSLHARRCQKPNSARWIKQSRRMSLLQGFWPACKLRNSRLREQWVLSCSQTKEFLWDHREVICLFQLIGCPVVFFLIWIRGAGWGERGNPELAWTDLEFEDWLVSSADFWEKL